MTVSPTRITGCSALSAWVRRGMRPVGTFFPCAHRSGYELKRHLVGASIAGIEAIWSVDGRARIVHVDPIIHVAPPFGRPELAPAAEAHRLAQFEAWDMLCGGAAP